MTTNDQRTEALNKILGSKYFYKSPTSKALLKYLVQASIDNVDIKESVIGMHIFGDRYDGEKSNARIRVSVYHLRKKLEKYYKNEGKNDDLILTIEKGQYQVTFVDGKTKSKTLKSTKFGIHIAYISFILILLVWYSAMHRKPNIPIWDSLFSNKKETVVYIGDVFGYLGHTPTGGWGWIRDYKVNSEEDFLLNKNQLNLSEEDVRAADYSYVTASEVDAVKAISGLFFQQEKDFSVRLASKIDEKDIKEQNIIYVGPIKTNNRFTQLLTEHFSQFIYQDEMLYLVDRKSGDYQSLSNLYNNKLNSNSSSEIAIVSKITGTYNTQQFLFFSDHDMGVRATVNYFTNKDSLQRFQDYNLKDQEDFTAIYLVKGKDRVDLSMKLLDVY